MQSHPKEILAMELLTPGRYIGEKDDEPFAEKMRACLQPWKSSSSNLLDWNKPSVETIDACGKSP